MSKVIYKYQFRITSVVHVSMPEGAKVLHFGNQHERLTIWVEVDTDAPIVEKRFWVIGTGQMIPDTVELNYVGTASFNDGRLIWHLYEVKR